MLRCSDLKRCGVYESYVRKKATLRALPYLLCSAESCVDVVVRMFRDDDIIQNACCGCAF